MNDQHLMLSVHAEQMCTICMCNLEISDNAQYLPLMSAYLLKHFHFGI